MAAHHDARHSLLEPAHRRESPRAPGPPHPCHPRQKLQRTSLPGSNAPAHPVSQYTKYTTAELDAAASLLANHLKDTGVLPGRAKGDATSRLTIGLLGVSNIDYVVTEMTLYRMGYCSSVSIPLHGSVLHPVSQASSSSPQTTRRPRLHIS